MELRAELDFETGCAAELVGPRSVGVHKYVEDDTFRVWLFSYSFGNGYVHRWKPGDGDPVRLLDHVRNGGVVVSHNAMFERCVWSALRDKYKLHHWPELKAEQQRCTMVKAMALNLPASLDMLGSVLNAKQQKDVEGSALMKRMAKPLKSKGNDILWHDAPEKIERLGIYCDQDIRSESEIDRTVPDLSPYEQYMYTIDQRINDRGFPLDVPSICRAVDVVEYAKKRANQLVKEYTDGAVSKITEVQKIVDWINTQGVNCTSFRKGDHDDLLITSATQGATKVEQVIKLRRGSSKTSTSKFLKMLECVCADGRARGQFQFNGATQTLRWAGRLIQPQNLRRIDWARDGATIEWVLMCLAAPLSVIDTYDMICMFVEDPLDALSLCLRAMIKAEPGHTFYGADWSNIEGRMNAFLAGEQWKLDAFRAYDNGTGPDLYKLAYSRSFGKPVEQVGKGQERQIGKVQELALGYQGGVGAFITMGLTYNVKVHELVEPVRAASSAELWDKIESGYKSAPDKHGLPPDQWTAVKIIVTNWRAAHPFIKDSWYELQDAAVHAVSNPNTVVNVYQGRVRYLSDTNYLYCQLPSGHVICYPQPHLRYEKTEYVEIGGEWKETVDFFPYELEILKEAGAKFKTRSKHVVFFMGVDPETKQWRESYLYGGHQCENIVQAASACVLRAAMIKIEEAGYPIVLHAHDEILAHVKKGFGSLKHFESLMLVDDPWLVGMPLAVSSFEDERYVK